MRVKTGKDVHTAYCCREHGCNYGRSRFNRCSVADDGEPQLHPCWVCRDWIEENWDMIALANELWDRGYGAGLSVVEVR